MCQQFSNTTADSLKKLRPTAGFEQRLVQNRPTFYGYFLKRKSHGRIWKLIDNLSGCGETLRFGEDFNRYLATDGESVRRLYVAAMKTKCGDLPPASL
jgi:hypothetical protein